MRQVTRTKAAKLRREIADRLAPKLAKLVYVDTALLPNGMSLIEFYPADMRKTYRQRVAMEGGGKRLPFPPWEELDKAGSAKDLGDELRSAIKARATDMRHALCERGVRLPQRHVQQH